MSVPRVTLFEDIFHISSLNPEGKKFSSVNRLQGSGTSFGCSLLLDINSDLYTVKENDKLTIVLASTLDPNGTPSDGTWKESGTSLADNYDYVTHGKVYLYQHLGMTAVEIQISFGGLLMQLKGDREQLEAIEGDMDVYCLIKKG
ncbi:hypothetical protein TL16_g00484 [Triparma laevis f. inornata]|uniref:DNA-directed RNA polymerases I, II, and III subunit RPABC3 n=2 Tax=Triparma laevis TaxID=1534972 RepID=A0A9W7DNU2_9STRA|nr:hypothetical protein TL16_g00484 [Triparma laevis f. inornata]GMH49863.1 hypothetical protein TrLO_g5030 [Triparma laevis f. longispina]